MLLWDKRVISIFTNEELELLWKNVDKIPFADMVLIGIYSGWRPQELSILKIEDIDLEGNIFLGGLKTEAGKNRYVSIHPLIKELVMRRCAEAAKMGSSSVTLTRLSKTSCRSSKKPCLFWENIIKPLKLEVAFDENKY